jgi:hypothetical protein
MLKRLPERPAVDSERDLVSQVNDVICLRIDHVELFLEDIPGINKMVLRDPGHDACADPEIIELAPDGIDIIPDFAIEIRIEPGFCVVLKVDLLPDVPGRDRAGLTFAVIHVLDLEPDPVSCLEPPDLLPVGEIQINPVTLAVAIVKPAFVYETVKQSRFKAFKEPVFRARLKIEGSHLGDVLIEPGLLGEDEIKILADFFFQRKIGPQPGIIHLCPAGLGCRYKNGDQPKEYPWTFIFQNSKW